MTPTTPERAQAILGDLAERGYALACKLQDQAMAAEDAQATGRISEDFHRTARTVRQILALQARLARDVAQLAREDRAEAAGEARARVEARRAQVAATVSRIIGEDTAGFQARDLREDLRTRLDEDALFDDFLDESLEDQVERLSAELGLGAEPDGTPRTPRHGLSPGAQARIHELLSGIPDEEDEDDEGDDDEGDDDEPGDAAAADEAPAPPPRLEPFPPRHEALADDYWRTDGYG